MKCSSCGSSELVKLSENLKDRLFYSIDARISPRLIVYVCKSCKHLEFYDNGDIMNEISKIDAIDIQIKEFEKQLALDLSPLKNQVLEYENEKNLVKNDIEKLKQDLSNEDITVREHNSIKDKIEILNSKINNLQHEINILKDRITIEERKKRAEFNRKINKNNSVY